MHIVKFLLNYCNFQARYCIFYSCKKPQNHGRIVIENRKSQLFARLLFTLCLPSLSLSLSHALSLSVSSSVPPAGCWIQINISICVNNEHFDSCPTNDNHIQNTVRYQQKESGKPRESVSKSVLREVLRTQSFKRSNSSKHITKTLQKS